MDEKIISLETAKLAKEKGFDEPCNIVYYDPPKKVLMGKTEYSVPKTNVFEKRTSAYYKSPPKDSISRYHACTQSLLQKWLRDIHNIEIEIHFFYNDNEQKKYYTGTIFHIRNYGKNDISISKWQLSYEDVLEKCLQTALNLINGEK